MDRNDFYAQRNRFFLTLTPAGRGGLYLCALLGIATFVAGMMLGDTQRTWGSFLFNLFFFFCIALGGVALGSMQDVIGAVWGRPIRRIHEAFGAFVPMALICFAGFLICLKLNVWEAKSLYKWIVNPEMLHHFPGKSTWLQENFMLIRNGVALVLLGILTGWQVSLGVKRDLALVAGDRQKATMLGEKARHILRYWAAPVMVAYSLLFSLLVFDLLMSLAPTWLSTLWGGWCFSIMMQTLFASLLLMMFFLQRSPLGAFYGQKQFHDVGKLLHGFTVFFAYLTFAHILTYWYTNIPEETSYFIDRLKEPWIYLVIVSPFLTFVFPFFMLIPKASKWLAPVTIPIAFVALAGQWLSFLLVVMPEVTDGKGLVFPWIEIGIFLGFLGCFLASFFRFASKVPMLPIADPLLKEALASHH